MSTAQNFETMPDTLAFTVSMRSMNATIMACIASVHHFRDHGNKSLQAERILQALQSLYVKATAEFMDFVLGDLTALNAMFQSGSFKLHCLIPEGERLRPQKNFSSHALQIAGKYLFSFVTGEAEKAINSRLFRKLTATQKYNVCLKVISGYFRSKMPLQEYKRQNKS